MRLKCLIFSTAALIAFGISSAAFAATNTSGQPLLLTSSAGDNLEIAFSPSVSGSYVDDTNTGSAVQWYVIGTYHAGGSKMYGSSQSLTKIYSREWVDGETKSFSELPATFENAASEQQWTDAGFED